MTAAATLGLAVALSAAAGGCSRQEPPARQVDNPDPAGKIPAIKQRVEGKDLAVIRQLVRDLGCDDPAVRLFAIEGLERLTGGQTFGYAYYADEDSRRDAVRLWRQWLAGMEGK